jgi:hypothetical protein
MDIYTVTLVYSDSVEEETYCVEEYWHTDAHMTTQYTLAEYMIGIQSTI